MANTRESSMLEPVRLVFASRERRFALFAFAILYAWEYLAFFSSALTRTSTVISPCLPEHCWAAAGLSAAACSLVFLAKRRHKPLYFVERLALPAALLMGAGSLGIALLFTFNVYAEVLPYVCAGLVGLTLPFLYLHRIKHFAQLETAFLGTFFGLAFILALVMYLLFILLPSPFAVAFCTVAPAAFVLLGSKQHAPELAEDGFAQTAGSAEKPTDDAGVLPQTLSGEGGPSRATRFSLKSLLLNYASVFIFVVWLNFAFFRVIAAPWDFESQSWYYPSVFVTTLVVLIAILLFIRLSALRQHQRGQASFAVVAFAVSYLILYVRFYNPLLATVAFAFCFACMIALEALAWSFWHQRAKEEPAHASVPLLAYLVVKGVGVFVGVVLGEWSCLFTEGIIPVTAPLLFLVLLFACAMVVKLEDFDKLFVGTRETRPTQGYVTDFGPLVIAESIEARQVDDTTPHDTHETRADSTADELAARYALSPRETDVARLLLAGRNRPFIKEALFISTGTVNSHISSIYRKTGVKSQQELISLAEHVALR